MTKKKVHPQKRGRKTLYKAEYVEQAFNYGLLGLTEEQMAGAFGIAPQNFEMWKKKHPEFREAIRSAREPADGKVIRSLYERANGYEYDEQVPTKVKKVLYENGKRKSEVEEVIVTTVHRIVPPEPRAVQYWLNNRRRRKPVEDADIAADAGVWADRHEVDHTTKGERLPAPEVYLPIDLPENIVGEPPAGDTLTSDGQ